MKKQLPVFFVALLFLFVQACVIFADGMVISRTDPSSSEHWDYSDESDQQAFINYKNGLEKMIVGIKLDNADSNAVWLFPVPANPEKVVMDVVDDLPQMNGEEISGVAQKNLSDAKVFLYNSQVYPLLPSLFGGGETQYASEGDTIGIATSLPMAAGNSEAVAQDVAVYEHLDKEGMTSEIVTAKTANGLYDYLKNKGLNIQEGTIPVLNNYVGKDYSFVVSWIASPGANALGQNSNASNQFIEDNLGSYLMQPEINGIVAGVRAKYPALEDPYDDSTVTDNVIYLTSDEGKPALAELIKDVQASPVAQIIAARLNPDYSPTTDSADLNGVKGVSVMFPTSKIYFPLLPTSVYDSKTVPATIKVAGLVSPKIYHDIANFTTVNYYTNADLSGQGTFFNGTEGNNYTKIEINAPSKYLTDDLWMQNHAPLKIDYSSFVAFHPNITAVILLALCSMLAALVCGWLLLRGLRNRPGKLALLGLSNCLTLIGLIVATVVTKTGEATNGKDNESLLQQASQKGYIWKRRTALVLFFVAPFLVFLINDSLLPGVLAGFIPMIMIIIGLEIRRVKESDSELMAKLNAAGYSTWTFTPKSANKPLFVIAFTILFMFVSWLATELLKHTV